MVCLKGREDWDDNKMQTHRNPLFIQAFILAQIFDIFPYGVYSN